jgi:hypothetical protein
MGTRKRRRRYGPKASKSVEGTGGRGGRVRSRKQAIAIGLSEARKTGAKVPERSR